MCGSEKKKSRGRRGRTRGPWGPAGGRPKTVGPMSPIVFGTCLGRFSAPGGPKNRFSADGPRGRTHGSKLAPTHPPDPKIRSRGRTEVICEKSIFGPKKGRLEPLDHVFERERGGFAAFWQNLARADTIYSVGDENQVWSSTLRDNGQKSRKQRKRSARNEEIARGGYPILKQLIWGRNLHSTKKDQFATPKWPIKRALFGSLLSVFFSCFSTFFTKFSQK